MASPLPISVDSIQSQTEFDFVSYEKMSEDTNPWPSRKLNSIKQWIAMEKVHGANFSFTVHPVGRDSEKSSERKDSLVVKVAKRGGYLKGVEYFFGVHRQEGFLEREKERAKTVFSAVNQMCGSPSRSVLAVTVYGELFGGFYPHPSVPSCPGVIPVQTEVVYCPDLKFMAYDIALFSKSTTSEECQRIYLDYDVCMKLFKLCGFLYAEPLATGSLQTMLNYPLGFNTKLPSKLGMPKLPEGTKPNIAEGIVIKPIKNLVLSTPKGERRVIFKRKVEGFMEKKQRNWQDRKKGGKGSGVGYNQEYELLRYEMVALVTEQRLVNVISKVGLPVSTCPVEPEGTKGERQLSTVVNEDWREIEEGLVADVLEELTLEHEDLWANLQQQPMLVGQLLEELNHECTSTVEQYRDQH